jgi:glycosyltransferase involved in cell wall biosynthesis
MRILLLLSRLPYPATDGLVIPMYELLRRWRGKHAVTVACFAGREGFGPEGEAWARLYCERLVLLPRRRRLAYLLPWNWGNLLRSMPFSLFPYAGGEARRLVAGLLREGKFDVVLCHLALTAGVFDREPALPAAIIVQDALYNLLARNVPFVQGRLRRAYLRAEAFLYRRYEARHYPLFQRGFVVSGAEAERVRQICPGWEVVVLPNGVDADDFRPADTPPEGPPRIVFTGALESVTNEDAAWRLATQIFPGIGKVYPDAEMDVVGKNPSARLVQLAAENPRVRVTGAVPEVAPYLRAATLFLSPLRDATGIKNSVLQALASGLPVLVSPRSAEGIEGRDGCDFIVCPGEAEFTAHAIRLLADPAARAQLGDNARRLIARAYTWQSYADRLENSLHDICAGRQLSPTAGSSADANPHHD